MRILLLTATAVGLALESLSAGAAVDPTISLASVGPNPADYRDPHAFVATVQGGAGAPAGPVTFFDAGQAIPGCTLRPLGSGGTARCDTALALGSHSITARYEGSAIYNAATSAPLAFEVGFGLGQNVAAASRGAVAYASSESGPSHPISHLNDTEFVQNWWEDATHGVFPDWAEVRFAGWKVIGSVTLASLPGYWITDFDVQGWTGSAWVTLATVTGNTQDSVNIAFPMFTTDRVRVNVAQAPYFKSRIVELIALGVDGVSPSYVNAALASRGGKAFASSTYGPGAPVASLIDGDRSGATWGSGGGWEDATFDSWPDWVQVELAEHHSIDKVVVRTLHDAVQYPYEVPDSHPAMLYGVADFEVEGWDGSAWQSLGSVSGNAQAARTLSFAPFLTDRIRVRVDDGRYHKSRLVEVEAWGVPPAYSNVALASAGGVATASSDRGPPVSSLQAVIDDDRMAAGWGDGAGWEDGTYLAYPDWLQVDFDGRKTIDSVVAYSLRDDYARAVEPTDSTTFSRYGLVDFSIEGWDGTGWVTLATVAGNDLAKREVTFAPMTTERIRVLVTQGAGSASRIVEVEAWGTHAPRRNVALAALGASASASSQYPAPGFSSLSAMIDGDRTGAAWGAGGGWEDDTHGSWPDSAEVNLGTMRVIDGVTLHSLRDNYGNPGLPGEAETFSRYGITDFTIEGWNGGGWTALATVTGNDLVQRAVSFAPFATDRVRVNVTASQYFKSRIVELEAWGY